MGGRGRLFSPGRLLSIWPQASPAPPDKSPSVCSAPGQTAGLSLLFHSAFWTVTPSCPLRRSWHTLPTTPLLMKSLETGQPTWCGTTTCVSAVFTPGQAVWARLARRLPSCQGRCGCSWRPEPIPGRLGVSVLPPVNQGRLLPSQALGSFPGSFPPVQFPRPRIPVSDSFLAVMPRARDTPAEACAGPLPPPQDSLSPSGYQAEGNSPSQTPHIDSSTLVR